MQIYEITRKPRVNEVLGAMASTLGSALAQKAASAVGANLDDPSGREGPYATAAQRQGAAMKMNAGMIKALAKKAQETWATEIQNMIVQHKPKIISVDSLKLPAIELELQTLINSLAGFDVTKLAASKDTTGQSQLLAKELEKAKEEVIKATMAPKTDPAAMSRAWEGLATMIAQAQNTKQFAGTDAEGSETGQPAKITFDAGQMLYNGKPFNAGDPSHVLAQKMQTQNLPKT